MLRNDQKIFENELLKPVCASRCKGLVCHFISELSNGQGEGTLPTMKPEGKGGAKKERVEIDFSKVKVEPLFEEEMLNLLLVDDRIPAGAKLY